MKYKSIVVGVSLAVLAGCASNPKPSLVESPKVTALQSQTLTTNFKRRGVKIEWDCMWPTGILESTCVETKVKSIEVTGYAPSNGNSEFLREQAFEVAAANAKRKAIQFMKEDINSSQTIQTLAKNVEKANDKIKQRISNAEAVEFSDTDASTDTNFAVRENSNNIARNITSIIRSNASGILIGFRVHEEEIVDKQTVSVTIRWDQKTLRAIPDLRQAIVVR